MSERFYITTAIPYANGAPHIGHAYERIATDAIQRFMRLDGRDVLFVTGMDEYGLKVQQTAARDGVSPQEFVDAVGGEILRHGRNPQRPRRRHRAHDAAAPRPLGAGNLAAHGGQRRHLPVQILRLVFGARRGLLWRGRAQRRPGRAKARAVRRAGGMGRRGELFFPPLGLCAKNSSPTTRPTPTSSRRKSTATRSSPSSSAGSPTFRSAAPISIGACQSPATPST